MASTAISNCQYTKYVEGETTIDNSEWGMFTMLETNLEQA